MRKQDFVSLEISSSAVKRIHLEVVGDQIFWKRADLIEIPPRAQADWGEQVVKAIRQLVSGFESLDKKSVGLVINSAQGWARLLLLPKMSFGELVAAIGLQVKKDTPLLPEETEFKYHIGKPPAGGKAQKFRVIFSCIPKAVAKEQRDLLSQAEVQPTFEAFAPFSFKKWSSVHPVLPQTTFAILDVGARLTEINVYEGYRLQYSRRILLGSETFNDALCSEGLIHYQGPPEELARRKLSVTRPVFERFQGELRRSLHYFTDEFRCELPEQLYLTGGGSNLEGLKEFLERVLEMKIQKLEVLNFAQLSGEVAKRGDGLLRFTRLFLGTVGEIDGREVVPLEAKIPFVPLVAGLGGLAVIISLGFLLQIGLLDRKIEAANRTLKELDPTYIPASAKKALEDQVNARWNLMDRFAQKEPYWEDLFVELSHAVHEHVQLTAMEYKEGLFTLQGIYNQKSDEGEGTIPTLLRNLSQGLFTDAKLSSTKAIPNKEGYFGFTVTCKPVR